MCCRAAEKFLWCRRGENSRQVSPVDLVGRRGAERETFGQTLGCDSQKEGNLGRRHVPAGLVDSFFMLGYVVLLVWLGRPARLVKGSFAATKGRDSAIAELRGDGALGWESVGNETI